MAKPISSPATPRAVAGPCRKPVPDQVGLGSQPQGRRGTDHPAQEPKRIEPAVVPSPSHELVCGMGAAPHDIGIDQDDAEPRSNEAERKSAAERRTYDSSLTAAATEAAVATT